MSARRLLLASMLALASAVSGACSGGGPDGFSALLVTVDTMRADALGTYGRRPSLTPRLDALAEESVVYDAAYTVAPLTLPSHASMLTGLYPIRHTVRDNGRAPLPQTADTLAELAREAGYRTGAFIAAPVLDRIFALDQGFDHYDAPVHMTTQVAGHERSRDGREVVGRALRWLEEDAERPFFLWVHLFDPHAPYEPPADLHLGDDGTSLYLGEVASADREIGRLVDALAADGRLARTAILVVADHGESLGEHAELTHGAFLHEAVLRVPLMVRHPDGARAGERSSAMISVVDVAPTLAEAMGLAPPPDLDGASLWDGDPSGERGIYFECYAGYLSYGWSPLSGWMDSEGKLLQGTRSRLFDLASDPGEKNDLAADRVTDVERYRARIAELAAKSALEAGDEEGVDESLLANIRALGYAAMGPRSVEIPHPLEPTDRPDPLDRAQALTDTYRAMDLSSRGEVTEAIRILEVVTSENPRNWFALDHLVKLWIQEERYLDAIAPIQRMIREGHETSGNHYNLGACLWIAGRRNESLAAMRRAVELAPGERLYLEKLIPLLIQSDLRDEAAGYQERLRSLPLGG